jgi:hypothetical protein
MSAEDPARPALTTQWPHRPRILEVWSSAFRARHRLGDSANDASANDALFAESVRAVSVVAILRGNLALNAAPNPSPSLFASIVPPCKSIK